MLNNKWIRGALPALLIHCSIGSVYCWSLFKNDIDASYNGLKYSVDSSFGQMSQRVEYGFDSH